MYRLFALPLAFVLAGCPEETKTEAPDASPAAPMVTAPAPTPTPVPTPQAVPPPAADTPRTDAAAPDAAAKKK
jgi:hypothetical protein